MARSILTQNLESISADGAISPVADENSRADEPGHVAMTLGEYYRATGDTLLNRVDIVDAAARCINSQIKEDTESENGLGYSALGLLAFGPSKERNIVWERLNDDTRVLLDRRLLHRSDYDNHFQAFNIAKAVARFSLGLSKKDETGSLIERFIERIKTNGTGAFCDDCAKSVDKRTDVLGGAYDLYGIMQFVFIRSALQLHSNVHLRDRKLPSLRTYAEKYLKILPDIVRQDGLGWCYGRGIGAYGQMHAISLILQSMRDNWIPPEKVPLYKDLVRRLFQFFFVTYLDQEQGFLVIRDAERDTIPHHTTRMANFDAARYLCQWSRLAKIIGGTMEGRPSILQRPSCRYVQFDKSTHKEQGLCIYQDPATGLHVQIPIVSGGTHKKSDSLAFPHMPGVFDWPANQYLPVFLPELTIGDNQFVPSFYGKNITTGLGVKANSFVFKFDQPEFINKDEKIIKGIGSCKVEWEFFGGKITSKFSFQVRQEVALQKLRYILPIAAPHHHYRLGTSFTLGAESLRCAVIKDDFQANWTDTEVVSEDPAHRGYYGKIHYYQMLVREHPLNMRPGQTYRLEVTFEPDIAMIDEFAS